MEEQQVQPNTSPNAPMADVMPTALPEHRHKKLLLIIAGVVIVIGLGAWLFYRHYKKMHPTPLQTLQALEKSSQPVTAPSQERAADLKKIESRSAPVKASADDRHAMLNALK